MIKSRAIWVQNRKVFDFGIIMYDIVRLFRELAYLYTNKGLRLNHLDYKAPFL